MSTPAVSQVVQWLLVVTRRISRDRAQGRLAAQVAPVELGNNATDAVLGDLTLRERGSELEDTITDPTLWAPRP